MRSKADQAFVVPPPEVEEPAAPRAADLMAALKASVEAARQARSGARSGKPRRTG